MNKLPRFFTTTEGKFLTFIGALVVLSFAYYFYAMNSRENAPVKEVTINEQDHIRGTVGAKVTLVEFGDFQCPACASYEPILHKVMADNVGTLQFVFRHFPLTQIHQNALLAAKASESAALQGKFWEMHDILYEKQTEWSGGLNARDMFVGYATTLGLDAEKFLSDLSNASIEGKILAEYKEGVSLGVGGTPTFFLNGKKIDNPGTVEAFNKLIKEAAEQQTANSN